MLRTLRHVPLAIFAATAIGGGGTALDASTQSLSPSAGAPISIDATPVLAVGPFVRAVRPFLMADGRLVVPENASRSLQVHAPDGRLVTTLGGAGEGPGRLSWIRSAWNRGDTIEAFDWRAQRITRFLAEGTTEIVTVPRPVATDTSAFPLGSGLADDIVGPLGDGWAIATIAAIRWEARDRMEVHTLARGAPGTVRIAQTDGLWRVRFDDGTGAHPFSPTALFAVHKGDVYVAESRTPSLRVYDALGALRREIPIPLVPPSPAALIVQQVLDSATTLDSPSFRGGRLLRAEPDFVNLSAFWDLLVDELGFLWIRPYNPFIHALALGGVPGGFGGPGGRWLVLAPDGREVGWVEVPEDLELEQITRDAVVGLVRDADGVESVRVHRLERR